MIMSYGIQYINGTKMHNTIAYKNRGLKVNFYHCPGEK